MTPSIVKVVEFAKAVPGFIQVGMVTVGRGHDPVYCQGHWVCQGRTGIYTGRHGNSWQRSWPRLLSRSLSLPRAYRAWQQLAEVMTPSIVKVVEIAKGVLGFIRRHGNSWQRSWPRLLSRSWIYKCRHGNSWQKQLTLPLTLLSVHFRVRRCRDPRSAHFDQWNGRYIIKLNY